MTVAQAYARFMILFFTAVSIPCLIKPLTDAPGGGFWLWPEAGKALGIFLINWVHFVVHGALAVFAVFAARRTSTARVFGWWVLGSCAVLVLIGLLTPDGVWLLPAEWSEDVVNGEIVATMEPSWYGFIPANPADDVINTLVGLSGLIAALPVGLQRWGYWRNETATA